ncbi:MAG: methionine gamma-lyase family protein [Clostridia bacterium]|nr:methionine gamma-lyase family protein [Clostridia bacterium]
MFNEKLLKLSEKIEMEIRPVFETYEKIAFNNQIKVLKAFKECKISDIHFNSTSGYGYDDIGRDVIDEVFAKAFGAEDCLVRHNIISGTHALATALFGVLRPSDIMLSVTGKPYDTLEEVIGIRGEDGNGSLKDYGIKYHQIDLVNGEIDYNAIKKYLQENKVKMVFIQRSKGYLDRPSLCIDEIKKISDFVKEIQKDVIVMVDNCYGEVVEEKEPTQVGVDIMAGSLIKNPGGGMAETGGYIAGRKDLITLCAYRLTSPGIGKEVGATLNQNKSIVKGLFFAPHIVKEAIKTAIFAAALYENLGFIVEPRFDSKRTDIISSIRFNDKDKLIAFCQGIQMGSPVDSHVLPEPWAMPGYSDEVIMAAGTFVQGASIELSADAPIKEPYLAYLQGGLTFESGKFGILSSCQNLIDKELINL